MLWPWGGAARTKCQTLEVPEYELEYELVLASASPRRRQLLGRLGLHPRVEPADIDETPRPAEAAADYVERLAREKAASAARPRTVVIAADTSVVCDGEILGKPDDPEHAARILQSLEGRTHQVMTGVAVARTDDADSTTVHTAVETSDVAMAELDDERRDWYTRTGEAGDKAGAYGLQGAASLFADQVSGSVTNVIGLPLPLVDELMNRHGLDLLSFRTAPIIDPVTSIADLALAYLTNPPVGPDDVVRFASPEQIISDFDRSVPLDFEETEPAHGAGELLHAVATVFERSVHTSHRRFVNQNFAGPDPLAVVGDWAAAALNTTSATFEAAPVFTLMERAVLDKLARLVGFAPADTTVPGIFCAGGSLATLHALQLARHRHDPNSVLSGWVGPPPKILVSDQGHYSVEKSAAMMGIGRNNVISIPTNADGTMRVDALEAAVDPSAPPIAVVATAGTTVTGAFDPLDAIADICSRHNIWLHVDGCYGGSALFSPRERHRLAGVERADSVVWNLHKMMGITQQCTALLVADPALLRDSFSTNADYLFQPDKQHGELDAGDNGFMCARRVDILKLWLTWKARGDTGFAERVEHGVDLADHLRSRVAASNGQFAAVNAGSFTNVCLTWVPPELRPLNLAELSNSAHDRLHRLAPRAKAVLQSNGSALIGFQPVDGLNVFRLLFMNPTVGLDDVDTMLDLLGAASEQEWPSTVD